MNWVKAILKSRLILLIAILFCFNSSAYADSKDSISYYQDELNIALSQGKKELIKSSCDNFLSYGIDHLEDLSSMPDFKEVEPFLETDSLSLLIYYSFGLIENISARYDKAEELFLFAEKHTRERYRHLNLLVLHQLSNNYRYKGEFKKCIEASISSRNVAEKLNDSSAIIDAIESLGIGYYYLEKYNETINFFKTSATYYESQQDSSQLVFTYNVLGLSYSKIEQYTLAEQFLKKTITISKLIDDTRSLGDGYNNLGLIYLKNKDYETSLSMFESALILIKENNDLRQVPIILSNTGRAKQLLGRINEAISDFKESKQLAIESNNKHSTLIANRNLYQLYVKEKRFDSAYHYLYQYQELNKLILEEKGALAIENIEMSFNAKEKEKEIELLKKEKTISTFQYLSIAAILLFIIAVGLFVIYRQQIRIKLSRDKLNDAKEKLEIFFENLRKKSNLINELESQIESIQVSSSKDEEGKLTKIAELESLKILTDDDWNYFKDLFSKVYPKFIPRLKKEHSDLTEGEKRMFVLIKLDLSNKEIANILGISVDSVNKSKYRLKKKLNLSEDQKIDFFVLDF